MLQLDAGGSERVVLDLVQYIDKRRFSVFVAAFSGGQLLQDFSRACTKLFYVRKGPGLDLAAMLRIGAIIRQYRIDVVNPHHYSPFVYSYLGSKVINNRSLVFTEHSVPEVTGLSAKHKLLCNALFFKTNAIVGISDEISKAFKTRFPMHAKRVISIPNGVDIELFQTPVNRNEVKAEFGIPPDAMVIGTVANFRKVKNHVCLLKALDILSKSHPELRVLLVGRGFPDDPENSEPDIRRLIKELGIGDRVIFAGYRSDIPRILRAIDIFCLPSLSEGLPVSILEAMAARIPVVGSDVRGIREVVSKEITGLLFPVNDHGSLAVMIERLINDSDLRASLREGAYDFVSRNHGMTQWIGRYQSLFLLS